MSQPDPVRDSLAAFTGWHVDRTGFGYRLRFSIDDLIANRIRGISYSLQGYSVTNYCPRIDSVEFDKVPIQFEVEESDLNDPSLISEAHYYTVGRQLHREGNPAKFLLRPIRGLTVTASWFRHGVPHCDSEPAVQTLHGVQVESLKDQYGNDLGSGLRMLIEQVDMEWIVEGAEQVFPGPSNAQMEQVELTLNTERRYHDHEQEPALKAMRAVWIWKFRRSEPHLVPVRIIINSLRESYLDDVWQSRDGTFTESTWREPGSEGTKSVSEFPPGFLIDRINLWGAPFLEPESWLQLEQAFSEIPD